LCHFTKRALFPGLTSGGDTNRGNGFEDTNPGETFSDKKSGLICNTQTLQTLVKKFPVLLPKFKNDDG